MSDISNIYSNTGVGFGPSSVEKVQKIEGADKSGANVIEKKSSIYGKTIGEPKLSEKAQEYYEKLKDKFHNMDFILVSKDQKENAKQHAVSYANANKTVVLIDEEKIERMAADMAYREQYEGIIENAANGFAQMKNKLQGSGAGVVGYGMEVNDDGTTTLFAVLEKQSAAQMERIAKARAEHRAQAKAEAKKEEKEKFKEKLEKSKEKDSIEETEAGSKSERVLLSGNSFEELFNKIDEFIQNLRADSVLTESEKAIGQNIDFSA